MSGRGVVLAEKLADGLQVEEDLSTFRAALNDEGFREIDGYRQEKANNVQYHLANAAYHALADAGPAPRDEPLPIAELLERFHTGLFSPSLTEFLADTSVQQSLFSIETWIRPDLTQTWREAAWAVAHEKRRGDGVAVHREDFVQEAREQVPLAHDIFGNPVMVKNTHLWKRPGRSMDCCTKSANRVWKRSEAGRGCPLVPGRRGQRSGPLVKTAAPRRPRLRGANPPGTHGLPHDSG